MTEVQESQSGPHVPVTPHVAHRLEAPDKVLAEVEALQRPQPRHRSRDPVEAIVGQDQRLQRVLHA